MPPGVSQYVTIETHTLFFAHNSLSVGNNIWINLSVISHIYYRLEMSKSYSCKYLSNPLRYKIISLLTYFIQT